MIKFKLYISSYLFIHSNHRNIHQGGEFLYLRGYMSNTYCAMMGRSSLAPTIYKLSYIHWETVTTVCIADLKSLTGDRVTLSNEKTHLAQMFANRKQGNRPMAYRHLNGKPLAWFAMKDRKRN